MISASKIRKSRLSREEVNSVISSSVLTDIQPFLEEVLTKSRDLTLSPEDFFVLQGRIAAEMINCEKQITALKVGASREGRNKEWKLREIRKAHHRMLRSVMDGVALRHLKFQRPLLRELTEHNKTGHLISEGLLKEVEQAERIVRESDQYVILNDLTNFLRYGDLTIISPSGEVSIMEIKKKGPPQGKQKKKLDALIETLNKGILGSGDRVADYIIIHGVPISFSDQVESIINKSIKAPDGVYSEKVSPYLWVRSNYIPQSLRYFKNSGLVPNPISCPFPKADILACTDSLMFFDEFSPNTMPYSVFPFTEKTVVEIMTGQIQLKAVLSKKQLIKSLKGKGWDLKLVPQESIDALFRNDDLEKIKEATRDPNYFHAMKKGGFTFAIPHESLTRISTEFRSVKSIVLEAEGMMAISYKDRSNALVAPQLSGESLIWK